jgi:hypothetical protein
VANSSFAQRELKWTPRKDFKQGLDETIQWYIDNQSCWQRLLERIQIKLQAPASKLQRNSNNQASNNQSAALPFGCWSLEFLWMLVPVRLSLRPSPRLRRGKRGRLWKLELLLPDIRYDFTIRLTIARHAATIKTASAPLDTFDPFL